MRDARPWLLPFAVAGVVLVAYVGFRQVPVLSQIDSASGSGATLSDNRPGGRGPLEAWRLHLRFDQATAASAPEWILHDGRERPRPGYELHWTPQHLTLELVRYGDRVALLGASRLAKAPRDVVFARRGARLTVLADGRSVIAVIDPLASSADVELARRDRRELPIQTWGFQSDGQLGGAVVVVHDDHSADGIDLVGISGAGAEEIARIWEGRDRFAMRVEDQALLAVRRAWQADPVRSPARFLSALGDAGQSCSRLPTGSPDAGPLRVWLAGAEVRASFVLADSDGAAMVTPAVDQLLSATETTRAAEGDGQLIGLVDALARRAVRRPGGNRPPLAVLEERRAWLRLLGDVAVRTQEATADTASDTLSWQLRLIAHASGCLAASGDDGPLPFPAEAPEWVAVRWRAFAGGDPKVSALPAVPVSPFTRDLLSGALEALARDAVIEPLAACGMAATAADRIADPSAPLPEPTEGVERREATLIRAIVVLNRLAAEALWRPERQKEVLRLAEIAHHELTRLGDGESLPLAARDPLAFALDRLVARRSSQITDPKRRLQGGQPAEPELPDLLAPYRRLLSGQEVAVRDIWLHDPTQLPPAQALAAALAMQEVAGVVRPDWSLLKALPCRTLPLPLLEPRVSPGGEPGPAEPP